MSFRPKRRSSARFSGPHPVAERVAPGRIGGGRGTGIQPSPRPNGCRRLPFGGDVLMRTEASLAAAADAARISKWNRTSQQP
jgi:hypothetical protein